MKVLDNEVKIACPLCGQHLVLDKTMLGTELECPTCGQPFLAVPPDADTVQDKNPETDAVSVAPPPLPPTEPAAAPPPPLGGAATPPPLLPVEESAMPPLLSSPELSARSLGKRHLFVIAAATMFLCLAGIMVFAIGPGSKPTEDENESEREQTPVESASRSNSQMPLSGTNERKHSVTTAPMSGTTGMSRSHMSAKTLCDEFVSGGSTVTVDGSTVHFWYHFGKPFTRINETTVRWDNGGENPPFLCEVVFSNDGTAKLTQDNTFFAREFRRNSLNEIANALRQAFNSLTSADSEIRNAAATVMTDGHILFSAEVSVSSGNVRESIGKVFFKMNCSRTLLRM